MNEKEFWPGQTLEIHTDDEKIYDTQILRVDDTLKIRLPVDRRGVTLAAEGAFPVTVYFHRMEEKMLYSFPTVLFKDMHREYLLAMPNEVEIKKAQRRKMFRVEIGVQVDLTTPDYADVIETVFTKDISGGGMACFSRAPLAERQAYVHGILHLQIEQQKEAIPFKARVVAIRKRTLHVFQTSLEFIELKERNREKIIKFCMTKQIEQAQLL